jgi:hypothetical protein
MEGLHHSACTNWADLYTSAKRERVSTPLPRKDRRRLALHVNQQLGGDAPRELDPGREDPGLLLRLW